MQHLDVDGLPYVAPGLNPYRVYIRALNDAMYRDPTPGLRARVIVLLSLNLLLANMLKLAWQREGFGFSEWRVNRPSGRYIVSNQRALCSIMSIIVGACAIAYLTDFYNVYVERGSQSNTSAWRAYIFLPLFAHGWIISWGGLQALILTTDHRKAPLMTARMANTLFVGGGILLTAIGVTAGSFFVRDGNRLYRVYRQVIQPLRQLKLEWQGDITPEQAQMIASSYFSVVARWRKFFHTGTWVYIVIGLLLPGTVVIINIGSLALTRVMQRHINVKKAHLSGLPDASDPESAIISAAVTAEDDSQTEFASARRPLTNHDVRELATKGSGLLRDHACQVLALQKARKDLFLIASSVAVISLILTGYLLGIAICCATGKFMIGYWPLWEACLLGFEWLYGTINVVIHIALFVVAARHRATMTSATTAAEPEHLAETLMMRSVTLSPRLPSGFEDFSGHKLRKPRPAALSNTKFNSGSSVATSAAHSDVVASSPTSLTFSDMLERGPSPMVYTASGAPPVSRLSWWRRTYAEDGRRASNTSLNIRVGVETDVQTERDGDIAPAN
ncbi:hypothetical protein OIV83_001982 [Microbotryomycetes sp. JL201]|nr:hypothetical protein OIV83_001982 [Microbotryomycetes sp. JL201]